MAKGGPAYGKDFCRGQQTVNDEAELLHVCSGNHCISTVPAILSLAACKIPLIENRNGEGEERVRKTIVFLGGREINSPI